MKVLVIILSLFITTVANADVASQALNKVSEKISNLIPGEGLTEVDISYRENLDNNFEINILGVRDIL